MYAIVKTGGKQYKVAPGDKLNIEKLEGKPGDKVELCAVCVVDGEKVETDPKKAASVKVVALILEQFRDKKQLVFKFKKRKNYKKLRGHRQYLTRVQIESVGSDKAAKMDKPATDGASKKTDAKPATKASEKAESAKVLKKAADKPTAKSATKSTAAKTATAEKKPATAAKKPASTSAAKKPAEKKDAAKKPAASTDKATDSKTSASGDKE